MQQWNVIRFRKENNLSQEKMAEILQINVTTYLRKELGKSLFNADEMFFLAAFFGKKLEEIFLPSDSINNRISEIESIKNRKEVI